MMMMMINTEADVHLRLGGLRDKSWKRRLGRPPKCWLDRIRDGVWVDNAVCGRHRVMPQSSLTCTNSGYGKGLVLVVDTKACRMGVVVSDDQVEVKKKNREDGLKEWLDAVTQCSTLSRLNVLVGVLESCVKWEKSAENAVSTTLALCLVSVIKCFLFIPDAAQSWPKARPAAAIVRSRVCERIELAVAAAD